MPRPTEQQKLRVRVQNSWSPRAMVLLLQTKERKTKVPEEVVQAVEQGLRSQAPLLLIKAVGPSQRLHHWPGRQRPSRV